MRKFEKLHKLGESRLGEIDRMLISGHTAASVAIVVCREWNEYPNEEQAITRQLQRYKRQSLIPNLKAQTESADPQKVEEAKEKLDCLERGRFLYDAQRERVERLLTREKNMPLPMKGTRDDLLGLNRINDSLSKLELETGAVRRAPRRSPHFHHFEAIKDYDYDLDSKLWDAEVREHADMRKALASCIAILQSPDEEVSEEEEQEIEERLFAPQPLALEKL